MRKSGARKRGFSGGEVASILLLVALAPVLCFAFERLNENTSQCYGELGCLGITRNWYHPINRLFNTLPLSREDIDTGFILFTKKNPTEGQLLRVNVNKSIKLSNFDGKRKTKFIIHGFIAKPLSDWAMEMRDELLKHGDYNVIIVDWAGGNGIPYYQATANTRLVGLEIAHLLKHLQKNYGLATNDVHLIGHSLGAHTAGYAGENLKGSIGRITGLDPAKPYFQDMPSFVRLDHTDAKLVDVIHTDGNSTPFLGYGMSQPCGHLDFYPNNGENQPGCTTSKTQPFLSLISMGGGLKEASRILKACNHMRAIKLFIESINSKCQYVAHECDSYQSFLKGKCFSCTSNNGLSCGVMGYHADTSPALVKRQAIGQNVSSLVGSRFFLGTGKKYPYCSRHYRLTIDLARPRKAERKVEGSLEVRFHSENGIIRDINLIQNNDMSLEHGTRTQRLVALQEIGKIKRVELSWEFQPHPFCFMNCEESLYVNSIDVDIMGLPEEGKRKTNVSSKLCSTNKQVYEVIESGSTATFADEC